MTLATALATLITAAGAHAPADCDKTFTAPMITRAIDAAYHGTRTVTRRDRAHLRRYVRCARRPAIRPRMHAYWHHAIRAWQLRRDPPMLGPVLASYYSEGGGGACAIGDVQSGYRFASLFLGCGAMVRMCHGASCVDAMMSDHGPYVGGRTFDLNVNLRDALSCSDLCSVTWRPL